MDYRFTDELVDPPGITDPFHTEKLIRLGRNFYSYTPPDILLDTGSPPVLSRGYLTFGSFNRASKLNPQVIALWARVLSALPEAKLLMQARIFDFASEKTGILEQFARHGIEPRRIETRGYARFEDYLCTHHEVDVILDTFPWNGHVNTAHALWMGVPTLTLAGTHHAGRFGYSLMTHAGLPEFIAHDEQEFVARALHIASNPGHLTQLRQTLRQRLIDSELCDAQGLTRRIEQAYRNLWQAWCQSRL